VDVYKTEDEQLEALKRWMRDNGRSVVTAVLAIALIGFGLYAWQQRQQRQQEEASLQFQSLVEVVRQLEQESSPEKLATARHVAEVLKTEYTQTAYAQFAALFKARLAVQDNDLAQAESELRWVLERKPEADMQALTQLRLARVLHAKGEHDAALALLDESKAGGYAFAVVQLRGDIKLARGDNAGARADYEKAQELERQLQAPVNDPLLEIKLRDLQTGTPAPATPSTEKHES
jgi:predicted negative regulator of RcsB-dependent stress response